MHHRIQPYLRACFPPCRLTRVLYSPTHCTRTQRPFFQYFSCRFLLWELSTPFLNIHWFLDKTGRTGSTLQLVNGVLLLATFFFVRIVYGWYTSIAFWRVMFQIRHEVSVPWWLVFMFAHAVLMTLNAIWCGLALSVSPRT